MVQFDDWVYRIPLSAWLPVRRTLKELEEALLSTSPNADTPEHFTYTQELQLRLAHQVAFARATALYNEKVSL